MRSLPSLAVGVGVLALTGVTTLLVHTPPWSRSAGPVKPAALLEAPEFSRADSTGLFVGVQLFTNDPLYTVPYAVDDAVDLAYKFSLDARVGLVPPRRVVLALSGRPHKKESRKKLKELRDAGATVEDASVENIDHLLKKQASLAGQHGIFVLSLATHGFQHESDAYILGAQSRFAQPESSLRLATVFDTAALARRSLIFVDACRDRAGQGSRGAAADPAARALPIRGMHRVEGQVIFYAAAPGHYAFDDHEHLNGVFTKAVLDGLNCGASAPRGAVVVETLHTFVERQVRNWIQKNRRDDAVDPATQISMEGHTRNMPLSECWRSAKANIRVSVDGSQIVAYDDDTRPLWRDDFGEPILHNAVADLDADAFYEVVLGFRDRIVVLDRRGKTLWTKRGDAMSLQTFATGDLFEKKTNQIVALWTDPRSSASRLSILDSDGKELSRLEHDGSLRHVIVGRPTRMHAPKIAVTTENSVLLLNPKKVSKGKPVWRRALHKGTIEIRDVRIADIDGDLRGDIGVSTTSGTTWFAFDGKILRQTGPAKWEELPKRRRSR